MSDEQMKEGAVTDSATPFKLTEQYPLESDQMALFRERMLIEENALLRQRLESEKSRADDAESLSKETDARLESQVAQVLVCMRGEDAARRSAAEWKAQARQAEDRVVSLNAALDVVVNHIRDVERKHHARLNAVMESAAEFGRLVVVESPYAGDVERNTAYVRACIADSLARGEAPFASHALYTLPGVLDDADPDQRRQGIEAGFSWGACASIRAVYHDHGITPGMREGIEEAKRIGQHVSYRLLHTQSDAGTEQDGGE